MKLKAIPVNLAPVVGAGLLILGMAIGPAAGQSGSGIGANLSDASSRSKAAVDIAADSYQCRKTLREVCILRRMSHHPNICRLDDCFTVPSDRGQRSRCP